MGAGPALATATSSCFPHNQKNTSASSLQSRVGGSVVGGVEVLVVGGSEIEVRFDNSVQCWGRRAPVVVTEKMSLFRGC